MFFELSKFDKIFKLLCYVNVSFSTSFQNKPWRQVDVGFSRLYCKYIIFGTSNGGLKNSFEKIFEKSSKNLLPDEQRSFAC